MLYYSIDGSSSCDLISACSDLTLRTFFLFYWYVHHRYLHVLTHSFPTLRASDLLDDVRAGFGVGVDQRPELRVVGRSEELTSELQSLMRNSYAVFCLKKKIKKQWYTQYNKNTK